MLRTELDLKTAKRWLMTRNKMITVDYPEGVDMHDPDLAVEMIVESTKVIDQLTELAEKWKELATKPFEVDERTIQWVVQVTTVKTELRLLMSMFVAAESIRRGEKNPLSWIVEEVMVSQMEERWKEAMTPKSLCLVEPQERAPNLSRSQQGLLGRSIKRLKGRQLRLRGC